MTAPAREDAGSLTYVPDQLVLFIDRSEGEEPTLYVTSLRSALKFVLHDWAHEPERQATATIIIGDSEFTGLESIRRLNDELGR